MCSSLLRTRHGRHVQNREWLFIQVTQPLWAKSPFCWSGIRCCSESLLRYRSLWEWLGLGWLTLRLQMHTYRWGMDLSWDFVSQHWFFGICLVDLHLEIHPALTGGTCQSSLWEGFKTKILVGIWEGGFSWSTRVANCTYLLPDTDLSWLGCLVWTTQIFLGSSCADGTV